jgi:diacylglycerol kinase (ATP)
LSTFVLFNPNAGSAGQADQLREALAGRPGVTTCQLASSDEVPACLAAALKDGHDTVVAAGGDGTVHRVVNALLAGAAPRSAARGKRRKKGAAPPADAGLLTPVRFGVLPLGTGNDLCRTLAIPFDPLGALDVLLARRERLVDLVRVEACGRSAYCVNVASGGFSAQVRGAMSKDLKATWGPLAYVFGAVQVLTELTPYQVRLRYNDHVVAREAAYNVIVANGRYAGGGHQVASQASIEDGLLDVVVVREGSLLDLTQVGAEVLAGDYLYSDLVARKQAWRVQVSGEPALPFSLDGEPWCEEAVTFTVVPQALRVIVGPEYVTNPAPL